MRFFADALRAVFLLSIGCIVVIQYLARVVGEEAIEKFLSSIAWPLQ